MIMGALDEQQLMFLGQPSSSRWVNDNFVIGDPLGSGKWKYLYISRISRRIVPFFI